MENKIETISQKKILKMDKWVEYRYDENGDKIETAKHLHITYL